MAFELLLKSTQFWSWLRSINQSVSACPFLRSLLQSDQSVNQHHQHPPPSISQSITSLNQNLLLLPFFTKISVSGDHRSVNQSVKIIKSALLESPSSVRPNWNKQSKDRPPAIRKKFVSHFASVVRFFNFIYLKNIINFLKFFEVEVKQIFFENLCCLYNFTVKIHVLFGEERWFFLIFF